MSLRRRTASFLRAVERRLRLDKRLQIAGAVALLLVSGLALAFGPAVRAVARSRAAAQGLELDIGGVRPGWFAIHLKDTALRLMGAPGVGARFDSLRVKLTPWLSLRGVEVEGGAVTLDGSLDALREQLAAWRAARPRGTSSEGASEPRQRPELRASGIELSWRGFDASPTVQTVSGIYVERQDDVTRAGFRDAKLESEWGRLSAHGADVTLANTPASLRTVKVAQVVGRVSLPAPDEAAAPANEAVVETPLPAAAARLDGRGAGKGKGARSTPLAKTKGGKPPKTKAAALAKPAAAGAAGTDRWLAARAEQAWSKRKGELARLRELIGRHIADGAAIDLDNVQLELARGSSVLNVGPAPLHLDRRADVLNAAFTSAADEEGRRLTVTGRLPLAEAPIDISLEGGPISLATLGVREGDFGLLGTADTALTVTTRVTLSPAGTLDVSASGQLHDLALKHAALAPEPLRDMDLHWGGQIRLDLGRRELSVERGSLGIASVQVFVDGSVAAVEDDLALSLRVEVPETPCQHLLEAAPRALLPMLSGLRLGGTFALHSSVDFDTRAPKDVRVEWDFDNECKVLETPEAVDPQRFREPFQHFVLDAEGRATEISTGPTTEQWVPLSDITPKMETALVVCEDSRFFSHDGFDNKAIRDSIIDNLQAGHFVRGASTLSMQLAKNLYLGREKTLSRKLQEAALTLLLEERLSKQDILELYLNVVEFGPGVYGIRNAAKHYFNSHPGELSLAQALYLASVLPSPKANHFDQAGALRERWAEHLRYLMRIARKINRISDEELDAGLNERLVFGQSHGESESDFSFETPLFELSDG